MLHSYLLVRLINNFLSSVPSAYPAGFSGLEFSPYTTRAGTIFDYGLEPSILGELQYCAKVMNLSFVVMMTNFQ